WTSLLDKGYHLAASYGKDWHRPQKEDTLFGCTYLDFDGEVNEENALNAIQNGRTVVSVGAEFSFTVCSNGREYRIGDTVPSGKAEFNFFADYTARKNNFGNKSIEYKTIKLVTNGGEAVCEMSEDTSSAEIEIKEKQWYRAELWGRIDGREQPLAITSPIYTK
ncbi:MAG: CehA/McbA family metallohydrolase, partial [Eubacterium sp.]|nr:CehA/McbA family metallohydrolase [Eubacterium sp.]